MFEKFKSKNIGMFRGNNKTLILDYPDKLYTINDDELRFKDNQNHDISNEHIYIKLICRELSSINKGMFVTYNLFICGEEENGKDNIFFKNGINLKCKQMDYIDHQKALIINQKMGHKAENIDRDIITALKYLIQQALDKNFKVVKEN